MSTPRGCRSCSDAYKVTQEGIARVLAAPVFRSEAAVPDDLYEQRLAACDSCPQLIESSMTCKVCGCFVQVRAKLRANDCPNPAGSRWQQAVAEAG
ncbi:DUF6171 family protein [Paenibacillus sp. S-38]|uniref:DUF6171 family protein n=1 Tax=Paenibacillus sp. S-38 TaxID=3416710 RepID=UPI003CF8F4B0